MDRGEPAGGGGDAEFDSDFDVVDAGESGAVEESGAFAGVAGAAGEIHVSDWRVSTGVFHGDEVSG